MKVCIIAPLSPGGISKYSFHLAKAIADQVEKVSILGYYKDEVYVPPFLDTTKIDLIKMSGKLNIEKLRSNFDIFHFQGTKGFQNLLYSLCKNKSAKKIVTTLHGPNSFDLHYFRNLGPKFKTSLKNRLRFFQPIDYFFYRLSRFNIFHSTIHKNLLEERYGEVHKNHVIRHIGYFSDFSELGLKSHSNAYNTPGDFILVPGSMSPLKSQHEILKAYASIDEKYCDIIFLGRDTTRGKYTKYMKKLANELGVAWQVKFLGWVDEIQLLILFNNCRGVVLPLKIQEIALKEGGVLKYLKNRFRSLQLEIHTSGVMIHALSAQKPIIGPKFETYAEYIPSDIGKLVRPGNINELMYGIKMLIKNQIKVNPNAQIFNDINPKKVAMEHIEIYRNVLKS